MILPRMILPNRPSPTFRWVHEHVTSDSGARPPAKFQWTKIRTYATLFSVRGEAKWERRCKAGYPASPTFSAQPSLDAPCGAHPLIPPFTVQNSPFSCGVQNVPTAKKRQYKTN